VLLGDTPPRGGRAPPRARDDDERD